MRPHYYTLVGQTPVPIEEDDPEKALLTWAMEREDHDPQDRVVAQSNAGPWWVSTVFLGIDHSLRYDGPPLLFETMLFLRGSHFGATADYQERCSTWAEAEEQHAEACRLARWSPRLWGQAFQVLMDVMNRYRSYDPDGRKRLARFAAAIP